jgi:hypothetical protein
VPMTKKGQILELKCEMPRCYYPDGRMHFDPWPEPRYDPELNKWSPNADHYPTLKRDGGKLKPWNVRLAHKFCNNMEDGWRKRIRSMLEKEPTRSFDAIAKTLNRKKKVLVPPARNRGRRRSFARRTSPSASARTVPGRRVDFRR